jgi:hypothetical protein
MVQPNYAFQKRQRDLAKKQKKEEKKLRKASGQDTAEPEDNAAPATPDPAADTDKSPP